MEGEQTLEKGRTRKGGNNTREELEDIKGAESTRFRRIRRSGRRGQKRTEAADAEKAATTESSCLSASSSLSSMPCAMHQMEMGSRDFAVAASIGLRHHLSSAASRVWLRRLTLLIELRTAGKNKNDRRRQAGSAPGWWPILYANACDSPVVLVLIRIFVIISVFMPVSALILISSAPSPVP